MKLQDNPIKKSGIIGHGLNKAKDGLTNGARKLVAGKSIFNSEVNPLNSTNNPSTNESDYKQTDTTSNQTRTPNHNDTSSSKSSDIIAQNTTSSQVSVNYLFSVVSQLLANFFFSFTSFYLILSV